MNNEVLNNLGEVCSVVTVQAVSTLHQMMWQFVQLLWSWYALFIVISLVIWIIYEVLTRNGTVHYNSENGFSPIFNSFVGSGVYTGLQTLLFLTFTYVFGDWIYCFGWPIVVHIVIFKLTGYLLHYIGFWPRVEKPGRKKMYKKRRRY